MRPFYTAPSALVAALLLSHAVAAPVSDRSTRRQKPEGTSQPPDSSGSSGQLRGSTSLQGYSPSNPVSQASTEISPDDFTLAPGQDLDTDYGVYLDLTQAKNPQPIRGGKTAPTDPGPRNTLLDVQNSDLFAPPGTDSGDVDNAKWPLGLSHNRHGLESAGWARQQNVKELPIATAMAGVDMRLEPHAYRELHWHKQAEWSYILNGSARLAASGPNGETFVDDLQAGDVWFFPAGIPHSIQALDGGVEFLLVFDDGNFSEDGTFLASELFARNPKSVLAKNFRVNVHDLDNTPTEELYIFPGTPAPQNISEQNATGPAGVLPKSEMYSYHLSQQEAYQTPGGTVKIIDPVTFPAASNFAVAIFTIEPGAMRELHWHTTSDEWNYFIKGQGRVTVFSAPEASRTFDFQAGDVGYIPVPDSHYVENTGNETLMYLEVLLADQYTDISVAQWLGTTPQQVVKDTLKVGQDFIDKLPKTKQFILPGDKDLTNLDFSNEAL